MFSIIQLTFTGPARARALSAYAAVLSVGAVAGLILGGVVVTANLFGLTWRPVFALNVPLGIVLALAVPRLVPPDAPRPARSPRAVQQHGADIRIGSVTMKAMSVIPGRAGSALTADLPDPPPADGSVLAQGLLVGICATDGEVLSGHGRPPAGRDRLVIGHESLGRVLQAPPDAPVRPGDLVVGVVRRPDPVPCPACAAGQWDFCANGEYGDRGIAGLDGYGSTRWRVQPEYAIKVPGELGDLGVLTEPGSIVAKAWEQVEAMSARAPRAPRPAQVALVTGAGPIGMLAALLGVQRGYQVHVFDRVTDGPKPALVAALGATYHHGPVAGLRLRPDVVLECTGAGDLVVALAGQLAQAGVLCLVGISSDQRRLPVAVDLIGASMVLRNSVIFGTVSAARRHYEQAAGALAAADPAWLNALISRRVPLSSWQHGFTPGPGDVKVAVDLTK